MTTKLIISSLIGILFILISCNNKLIDKKEEVEKITITEICYKELPNKDQLKYVKEKSINSSTIKIAKSLFSYNEGKVEMRKEFSRHDLNVLENYYKSVLKDVKNYWFRDKVDNQEFINLIIEKSLNSSTSCRTKGLRVTPFFLQSLYIECLENSIRNHKDFYKDRNNIKNINDFFYIIYSGNKINGEEEIALEFQRINLVVGFEFMKVFLFTLGHEFYHFLTDCELGPELEFNADLVGTYTYIILWSIYSFSDFDISDFDCYFSNNDSILLQQSEPIKVFELVLGRNLVPIVESIYKNTDFEKESITHPPLSQRLKIIGKYLKENNHDSIYQLLVEKEIFEF